MKISSLQLTGASSRPELTISKFSRQANVLHGGPGSGKSAMAQLAAQLLYGKTPRGWQQEEPAATRANDGTLAIETPRGRYVLRRHHDGTPLGRLTVAASDGAAVDGRTVQRLLGGASPRLAGRLYAIDFAEQPRVEDLFSAEFAREFNALVQDDGGGTTALDDADGNTADTAPRHEPRRLDQPQFNALVARRDELTQQLERHLAGRRQHSGDLQRQLSDWGTQSDELVERRQGLLGERQRLQAELAGITMRLRYYSLEDATRRAVPGEHERLQSELQQLDAEVGRCRDTLANLQQREATVRHDLAEVHADGAASDVDSLADQRATLGVIERLLDDLDAESALLARAVESDRRPAADAHARISPIADLLRQQAYALCGQITEQQRAFRRHHLQAEARQLTRAQTDLSEQLEQLLSQRQALLHRQRLETQPVVMYPDAPADGHCRCDHHGRFVVESEAMLLGRGDRTRDHDDARRAAGELESQLERLNTELAQLDGQLSAGRQQADQWQRSRAHVLESDEIVTLRRELEELEGAIARHLACGCDRPAISAPHGWRASDVLAQLTDGRLVQIRGPRGEEPGLVVDRDGRRRTFSQLTPGQRDQAYLAVTLALAASHGACGAQLPLILDEPFVRQSPADAAAMAGVLDSFAATGRQVLAFTADRDALRHFQGLGTTLLAINGLHAQSEPAAPVAEPTTTVETTTRVLRETIDESTPQLRVTGSWPTPDADSTAYYLTEAAGMADFPVLGDDTASAFAKLDVHTVGDLLAAAPLDVADRLQHPTATAAVVALWQTHMRLMCFVPGMSLNDAQLLAACGIDSPDAIAEWDLDEFAAAVKRFLATSHGARFATHSTRYTRDRFRTWRRSARQHRQRWQRSGARSAWRRYQTSSSRAASATERSDRSPRDSRTSGERGRRERRQRTERSRGEQTSRSRTESRRRSRGDRPLRFFLEVTSSVVDAPSIGDKTATLLANVGIRTVADLLACNSDSTAEELGESRITGEKLRTWQQQARLACRIPELRGYGAQLLVACGMTEPEQIAGSDPDEVVKTIRAFCRTKQGERIMRGGAAPKAEKIARWVENAAQRRSLDAA